MTGGNMRAGPTSSCLPTIRNTFARWTPGGSPAAALVLGATVESAAWELDRTLGQAVFKKAGIPVLPYKEFSDYDSAIRYVMRENRRFVSKPCGDEPDKSLSYVAKSPADLVYMLTRWKKAHKPGKGKFMLQEPARRRHGDGRGRVVRTGGLPCRRWCENFEEKHSCSRWSGSLDGRDGDRFALCGFIEAGAAGTRPAGGRTRAHRPYRVMWTSTASSTKMAIRGRWS